MSTLPPYDGSTPETPLYDQTPGSGYLPPTSPNISTSGGAGEKASQAKDETASVAGDARDASKHVAGVTKDQAQQVASEAKSQAKDLYQQATSELKEQAGTQQQKVADGLRSVSDELSSMAENGSGVAGELVRNLAGRAGSTASWLDGRDPGSLLDEVKSFAARKPGTFIAIAACAGILAGRLAKSLAANATSDTTPTGPATDTSETTTPVVGHTPYTQTTAPVPPAPAYGEYADTRSFDAIIDGPADTTRGNEPR